MLTILKELALLGLTLTIIVPLGLAAIALAFSHAELRDREV